MPQGIVSFAAPSNTALTASTTYYLVLYTTDTTELAVDLTEMEAEDAGGQAGWAIENKSYGQPREQPDANQAWAVYAPTDGLVKLRVREGQAATVDPTTGDPGDLDTGFGTGGKVTTAIGSDIDEAHAVAIDSDGKIVVAGRSNNGTDADFAVARYNADGTLDTGFGTGGKVTTAIGSDDDEARALAIDGDGKIVVVGNVRLAQSGNDFAMGVARYTAAGALDTTFDTDGKLTLDFSSTHGDYAHAVAIDSDGKIVVAGRVFVSGEDFNFAVARLTPAGALDTGFDTDGKADYSLNNNGQWGEAVAVQPDDGKILVAGSSWIPAADGTPAQDFDFAVARLTPAGALDTTFSGDGWDTRGLGTNSAYGQRAEAMALQSDGKIVLAGRAWVPGENWNFAVARLTTAGALDTIFNSSGYRITPVGSGDDQAHAVALQSDGKVILAGYSHNGSDNDFALVRYNTDGTLDTTFGQDGADTGDDPDGYVTTAIGTGTSDEAHAIALDSSGNILLAGFSVASGNADIALARYYSGQAQQPTPLDLSSLTVESTTDGTTWTALPLSPAFDSATTAYTATVGNDVTHVRLTPTLADTDSSVLVGKAGDSLMGVPSGSASDGIALDVGDNAITVQVTSADLTSFKDYTVTITRRAPQGAVLVSNVGQTASTGFATDVSSIAQGFTTGSASGGYALGSIEIVSNNTSITEAQRDSIRAELWSSSSGAPGSKLYDLAVPAHPIATGTVSFAAPANTTLAVRTTYYAVFYTVGSFDFDLGNTLSDSEDSGSAAGWSIRNAVSFVEADAPTSTTTWDSTTAALSITVREAQEALSANANLGGLTASGSATASGTFTAVSLIPAFRAGNTRYTATPLDTVTHVKLTPTVEDTGKATVAVGPQGGTLEAVTDTQDSAALALAVGDNAFTVRVTAEDGTTTKDYTVTFTRQAPQGAFLVSNAGQAEEEGTSDTGATSAAQAFTTGAVSGGYTLESIDAVIRATGITQAQRDSIRAELWSVASGGTPDRKIIDLAAPAHPVSAGTMSFAAPANMPLAASRTYYVVFYTVGAFNMQLGTTNLFAEDAGSAAGWSIGDTVYIGQGDAPTSSSSWSTDPGALLITVKGSEGQTGMPTVTASLSVMPNPVPEGTPVNVTVSLSPPLTSDVTIPLVITDGTAEPTDHGALASVVVPANAFSGTGTITTVRDDDGKDETFTVALGSLPAGVQPDVNGTSVTVTIADVAGATLLACPAEGRVWLADMTAGRNTSRGGTVRTGYGHPNKGTITVGGFMFQEAFYRIEGVNFNTHSSDPSLDNQLVLSLGPGLPWTSEMLDRLALSVDGTLFHLSASIRPQGADAQTRVWDAQLNWEEGQRVRLCLSESLVSLSLDRYRVPEGEDVVVKATLSRPVSSDVTVPTFFRDDRSNSGDHGPAPAITIPAGETVGRGNITTSQDADGRHERFRVALSRDRLPSSVRMGRPDSAPVTIVDDEWRTPVTVIVSASPNPVHEGSPVTVTAELRIGEDPAVLSYDVYVPLRVSRGSSEEGDHGTLLGITILAGERSGTGTIWTQRDGDGDDESFAVSMGGLPPGSPQMGCPNVVWVTISERASPPAPDGRDPRDGCPGGVPPEPVGGSGQQNAAPAQDPTAVTLALGNGSEASAARTVGEDAGNVTLTATLDVPAPPGGITLRLFAGADDTAARDADYTMPDTIVIRDGQRSGTATIAVTDDALDEADETANITAFAALFDGDLTGTAVLTITDDDPCATCGTEGEQGSEQRPSEEETPQQKYASLIAKIKEWRNDPRYVHDKAHTDRWDRTLLTFGETVADTTLEPMTADEAQTYADRGWTRWVEVTKALRELENQAPTVSSSIADATIVNESGTEQVSLSGVFDDPDNDSLTITATSSDEAVATVSVASDYSTLTVTAKSRGTATVTVTASDGKGGTVDDAFTVTVKAAPTVASAIGDVSGMEVFAAREISLSGVFRDADGDSLTLSASSSDDMVVEATLVDEALTIFTLAEGTATITVTAQDSDGNAVSDAFDVSVGADQQQQQQQQDPPPNQAPTVASAISDATIVSESGTEQVSLSGVFDDSDNDSLTITAASSDETKATVSVASDYSSLTVSAKARGTATINVTANDGNGGTVDDSFTVTVKAAPVVASPIGDVSMEEGDSRDISLSGVFSDADGDALTLSAASSDDAIVSAFEFGGTLTIVGVSAGSATITVTAQDADGNTVSDAFDVSVGAAEQQDGPTVAASLAGVTVIAVGGEWEVSLSGVFDVADGDDLTITAASSDDAVATVSVAADQSTLKVTGIAGGEAAITVTASDADGAQVSDALDVQVVKREEGSTQPANIRIVAGDGALTVSWTVTSRDGVEDDEIKHALRWSQVSGVWANPRDPHGGGPEDGISVEGGVASYTITGLQNGVATGVFVRSFTGGSRSERSEQSSKWVRVKGEHTTPRAE